MRIIGIIEAVIAFIVGLIVLTYDGYFNPLGAGIMAAGFISGMLLVGFAEVIYLLQKNVDKQDAILSFLKAQPAKGKVTPESVLQDIESNLPKM